MTREEITHDKVTYIIETYDNGAVVKYIKGEPYTPELPAPLPPEPTELEKQVTAIKADLELIKALTIQSATPPSDAPDMPPMPSGMDMPDMPDMP